jgi:chromosome segregation ATPase
LVEERQSASERLAKNEEKLRIAHEERASLLNATPEFDQGLFEERNTMLAELERLAKQRDDIVSNAREVRRAYAGMKMKLEVLGEEPNPNEHHLVEIEKTKIRLKELKNRFESLKQQRIEIGRAIEEGDAKIDRIDEKLQERRQQRRILASDAFMAIGDGNKEISALRAETALVDTKIRHLYAEIGRYVSRNTPRNPECTAVCAENRGLVDVMRALRRSIALNHRLAGIT